MRKIKFSFLFFTFFLIINYLSVTYAFRSVKITPMTNLYFERIYKINANNSINYLRISCKQRDLLSVSITSTLNFHPNPRFPVFDQFNFEHMLPHDQIPRMQKNMYTFLSFCPVQIDINEGKQIQDSQSFITIRRNASQGGNVIFTLKQFFHQNQNYSKINTYDPSIKWGMGQRFQKSFAIKDGTWTVYNRDRPWQIDNGLQSKSAQTYGHQPVYLARNRLNNLHHIVYFRNTFGFNYQSISNSEQMIYHSVGGPIHFQIFIGGKNPQHLIKHYHDYIGKIHIPPFWSLGWHQSRWGYRSLDHFRQVINNYNSANIPIDVMWSDLDYMNQKAIFTIDETNYYPKDFRAFLQQQNLHWIPLIDVGVSIKDSQGMNDGKSLNVFIKTKNSQDKQYLGKVWPGAVHFVDYLHPNATRYWMQQLNRLYTQVPFSGIWLDMNQPSNFDGNRPIQQTYRIQHSQSINMMTLDNDLPHYCYQTEKCSQLNNIHHFFEHKQVHSYYGHLSTIPTYRFLQKHGRPFIISRSNSVGTGRFAGHWTGDNVADWDFLRLSISGNFLFQIFGIQMVGADICGFHKNTNEDLCSRWMQVGSLYPFARSHNQNQSTAQQPYVLGNVVKETSYYVLRDRYSLLKQIYTQILMLNGTGSLYRPLFFEFYQDNKLISNTQAMQTQFMIGKYLMSAPIVQQGKKSRNVYFPGTNQTWYDITFVQKSPLKSLDQNSQEVHKYSSDSQTSIENKLPAPVPMFLRGGGMILTTQPKLRSKLLDNNFLIIAALNEKTFESSGNILGIGSYDNEDNIKHCISKGCQYQIKIALSQKSNDNLSQNKQFLIQWTGQNAKDSINIQGIRVFMEDTEWRLKQKFTLEKTGQKEVTFEVKTN